MCVGGGGGGGGVRGSGFGSCKERTQHLFFYKNLDLKVLLYPHIKHNIK